MATVNSGPEKTAPDANGPDVGAETGFIDRTKEDAGKAFQIIGTRAPIAKSSRAVPAADRRLFLNSYEGENLRPRWSWIDLVTSEASQEFDSEEDALSAMREERLEWSRLEDRG